MTEDINVCVQVAKAVSQALNRCVNSLPGQRDVDNAIRTVGEASKSLLADSVSTSFTTFLYYIPRQQVFD